MLFLCNVDVWTIEDNLNDSNFIINNQLEQQQQLSDLNSCVTTPWI